MPAVSARSALLDRLVDYAGLFPPAALPLGPVVETFARERAAADAWMLARLIIPAARLPELTEHRERLGAGTPWPLSVLGLAPSADGGADTPAAWLAAAEQTVAAAADADRDLGTLADRFELRVPAALARDPDTLAAALVALDGHLPLGAAVALEVPFLMQPETVEPAAHAVAEVNARVGEGRFALKLRCGGETPETIPPVEALARAMTEARRAGVAFKATAGLHEPLRHADDAVGATMHGFLNVFGGAALAARHGLDADALAELLDDGDAAHWRLDDALAWRSLAATGDEVAQARASVALSFGSCSFDEPRDGLAALGWR